MGNLILIIAFILEAAFAAYCMVTKSDQKQVRGTIRIGALAAFVLFTLVSVIQWSFRWYLLAALLFIWAVLGVWMLVRKTKHLKAYKPGVSLGRAIATMLLVLIAVTPALILPQYTLPKPTGNHKVATVNYSYTDPNRVETFGKTGGNREVNVEFWYPADGGGKYPLVVFSHGSFATKTSNTSTFIQLASNGYVVCSIDHPYHSLITKDAEGHTVTVDPAYFQEYMNINQGKYDDATEFQLETNWMQLRTADIEFILDTIIGKAKDAGSDAVYQLIDAQKIGLMGHSLGGESSAQVARERKDISAVINLDADLHGEYLSFANGKATLNDTPYPAPILTILGDDLVRLLDRIPDAQDVIAEKHVTATAPHAYEIHLSGTDHMSFTDLPLFSPFLVSLINSAVPKAGGVEVNPHATLETMNGIVLQFFDVYLKGEGEFTAAGWE